MSLVLLLYEVNIVYIFVDLKQLNHIWMILFKDDHILKRWTYQSLKRSYLIHKSIESLDLISSNAFDRSLDSYNMRLLYSHYTCFFLSC